MPRSLCSAASVREDRTNANEIHRQPESDGSVCSMLASATVQRAIARLDSKPI